MRIEVKCSKCGKTLNHRCDLTHALTDIVLLVDVCQNLDCRDCSKCDDLCRSKVKTSPDKRPT